VPGAIETQLWVKSERLAASIFRLDYPQERTSLLRSGTSDLCQNWTLPVRPRAPHFETPDQKRELPSETYCLAVSEGPPYNTGCTVGMHNKTSINIDIPKERAHARPGANACRSVICA
jgi:hypothetical protein